MVLRTSWTLGVAALAALALAAPAAADIFNVNTTADGSDFNTADPFCDADAGTMGEQCTLRAAIQQSITPPGQDTINVPAGTYTIDSATFGELFVGSDVIVSGAGAASTILRQTVSGRVFSVGGAGTLDLRGVTVQDGVLAAPGAGIFNSGVLILRNSVVRANNVTVGADQGGGIFNDSAANATILDSVVGDPAGGAAGNQAEQGGGIFNSAGADLTIRRSTVIGNTANSASDAGGGVLASGNLVVEDSTITGNASPFGSGGALNLTAGASARVERTLISANQSRDDGVLYTTTPLELRDSTISGNTSTNSGAAGMRADSSTASGTELDRVTFANNTGAFNSDLIVSSSTTITIRASIFASPGVSCFDFSTPGAITSLGFNLEDANDCGFDQATDRPNTNPVLAPLSNNGGPSATHALLPGSPAIDLLTGACAGTDQRGTARPQGPACDSGAFEVAVPRCGGRNPTHLGTAGADTINGTNGDDVVLALGGSDFIDTGPGDDLVCAGDGNDRVFTRAGVDRVFGEGGADRIFGGAARDFLFGQQGFDRLFGGAGGDRAVGGAQLDRLFGGPGFDRLLGQAGHDRLFGNAGKDFLNGAAGRDRLFGGAASDKLLGLGGRPDRCFGGPGSDRGGKGCERRVSIP